MSTVFLAINQLVSIVEPSLYCLIKIFCLNFHRHVRDVTLSLGSEVSATSANRNRALRQTQPPYGIGFIRRKMDGLLGGKIKNRFRID
jgi:hypothetical protein